MALEPYKDKSWLYEHYVKKRMNLTDIVKLLKQTYNIEITPQGLYNWCSKYDLLKFRGKGRNLSVTSLKIFERIWLTFSAFCIRAMYSPSV